MRLAVISDIHANLAALEAVDCAAEAAAGGMWYCQRQQPGRHATIRVTWLVHRIAGRQGQLSGTLMTPMIDLLFRQRAAAVIQPLNWQRRDVRSRSLGTDV